MRTGIIILCRFDSIRFPGKILKPIIEKPILSYILERVAFVDPHLKIIVATSNEQSDDPIESYCQENQVSIYRGSKLNVAHRFFSCAEKANLDFAIRINGDNIFTDPIIIRKMIEFSHTGHYNFLSNVQGRTFPPGTSVEMVNVQIMKKNISMFNDYEQEHVMPFFYKNLPENQILYYKNSEFKYPKGLHLALDTKNDFNKIESIIQNMIKPHWTYSTKEIIDLYLKLDLVYE